MRARQIATVLILGMILGGLIGYYGSRRSAAPALPDLSPSALARPAATGGAPPTDFVSVAKSAEAAVCHIATTAPVPEELRAWRQLFGEPTPERVPYNYGSGFFFSSRESLILTNFHVVQGADTIRIGLTEAEEVPARLVGFDPLLDVAVLRVDGRAPQYRPLPLGDSDQLEKGEWVLAAGNPFGLERTVTAGIVSAKGREFEEVGGRMAVTSYIQTDAAVNPGNSGGPLLNLNGQVVGINTFIIGRGGSIGIGFAIPINEVKRVLDRMVRGGRVTRGALGVTTVDPRSEDAKRLGITASQGAVIVEMAIGGPAERSGLQLGDVIIKFSGTPVRNPRHLRQLVLHQPGGATVPVEVIRQGRTVTLSVRLGSR